MSLFFAAQSCLLTESEAKENLVQHLARISYKNKEENVVKLLLNHGADLKKISINKYFSIHVDGLISLLTWPGIEVSSEVSIIAFTKY